MAFELISKTVKNASCFGNSNSIRNKGELQFVFKDNSSPTLTARVRVVNENNAEIPGLTFQITYNRTQTTTTINSVVKGLLPNNYTILVDVFEGLVSPVFLYKVQERFKVEAIGCADPQVLVANILPVTTEFKATPLTSTLSPCQLIEASNISYRPFTDSYRNAEFVFSYNQKKQLSNLKPPTCYFSLSVSVLYSLKLDDNSQYGFLTMNYETVKSFPKISDVKGLTVQLFVDEETIVDVVEKDLSRALSLLKLNPSTKNKKVVELILHSFQVTRALECTDGKNYCVVNLGNRDQVLSFQEAPDTQKRMSFKLTDKVKEIQNSFNENGSIKKIPDSYKLPGIIYLD
jgi:hypothetical protein